jgi:hypothetical protein
LIFDEFNCELGLFGLKILPGLAGLKILLALDGQYGFEAPFYELANPPCPS